MYIYPDPKTNDPTQRFWQRFFEMLPAALAWGTFIALIGLSFVLPFQVALFVLIFDLYWLFKAVYLSVHLIVAYRQMKSDIQIDWLDKAKSLKGFDEINHIVMFLTYDESPEVLSQSIESLAKMEYPLDKVLVVVATEEREGQARDKKEKYLIKKFKGTFREFIVTTHPDGIDGEMKAKGANATYAAKQMKGYLEQKNIAIDQTIISVFDSDTVSHPKYFAALTYEFLNAKNPHKHSYQPLPMYHNNIWDAPAFTRVVAISSSFWHMMESVRFDRMVTFSSHSMSFKTLVKVNYWPVNMVSDDSVIYWKCVNYYNGDYSVIPIHIPVSLDAVQAHNPIQAFKNQYFQMRRWAYGIENLATTMRSYAINSKAPLGDRIRRIGNMIEGHYTWATSAFILAIFIWFPIWFGGNAFQSTVFSNNLPRYASIIMNITLLGLIITAYINILLLPPRPKRYSKLRTTMMYLQWIFIPFVAIFLGALPAIEAQTRLLFGKYLGFWVTPKVRTNTKSKK
jgi:cellulose synthase/poly-beta-1,6-N-acetylglucosamine synthase-like glycosyltransferase